MPSSSKNGLPVLQDTGFFKDTIYLPLRVPRQIVGYGKVLSMQPRKGKGWGQMEPVGLVNQVGKAGEK